MSLPSGEPITACGSCGTPTGHVDGLCDDCLAELELIVWGDPDDDPDEALGFGEPHLDDAAFDERYEYRRRARMRTVETIYLPGDTSS